MKFFETHCNFLIAKDLIMIFFLQMKAFLHLYKSEFINHCNYLELSPFYCLIEYQIFSQAFYIFTQKYE